MKDKKKLNKEKIEKINGGFKAEIVEEKDNDGKIVYKVKDVKKGIVIVRSSNRDYIESYKNTYPGYFK